MCLPRCIPQSNSYGPWDRRRIVLTAAVISVVVVLFIVVIALVSVSGNDNECLGDLECLPVSKCEDNVNPDLIYDCGSQDSPKLCCKPKKQTTEQNKNEGNLEKASRIAKRKLLPEKCGIEDTEYKIAFGLDAGLGQFPWMVVLNYEVPGLPGVTTPECAATLINERYLLTAAHCTVNKRNKLAVGKLGDLNLKTDPDCEYEGDDKYCADNVVTIGIEKIIPHEDYNPISHKNDIALLRMKHNTNFTDFIKPICLPFGLTIDEDYIFSKNFTIAGWGYKTPSSNSVSDIMQFAHVSPWKSNRCNDAFKDPFTPIENRQICANGPDLQEACLGDSGGPMSYVQQYADNVLRTTQLGIVSFKPMMTCGSVNIPAVFTRVDKYLDWILDNIEP